MRGIPHLLVDGRRQRRRSKRMKDRAIGAAYPGCRYIPLAPPQIKGPDVSSDYYRRQVDGLTRDLAILEGRIATERDRAARSRATGLAAEQSITRSTSLSTARSKQREVQRREESAVRYDRAASRLSAQSATKKRALSDAQRHLADAEASERRRDERARTRATGVSHPIVVGEPRQMQTRVPVSTPRSRGRKPPVQPISVVRLEGEGPGDALLEVSKAAALSALSYVPVIGPVLRELVGVSWVDLRAERLERFAAQLGRDVEQLQGRIDEEFVRHSEFESLAEQALERVAQRRNEAKIERFSAAVANSATIDRPEERLRDRYLDWLDELRPVHLAVLMAISSGDSGWSREGDIITTGQVVQSKLNYVLRGLNVDPYDLSSLQQRGLIGSLDNGVVLLAAADDITRLITPAGRAFLGFVGGVGAATDVRRPENDGRV